MNDNVNNTSLLSQALGIAVGNHFIKEDHAAIVFKNFLRKVGLDSLPEVKKETPKTEVKAA